jgi:multidrug efflux pump subunit AcrA (membrane-fusion protein)
MAVQLKFRLTYVSRTFAFWLIVVSLISIPHDSLFASENGQSSHPVRVGIVEHRPVVRKVSTYGVLVPKIEDLSFRINGRIEQFMVNEGQLVEKGEVLAKLETRDAKDVLERAALELEQAKRQYARFAKLADDKLIQIAELEKTEDTLDAARIGYEQAELNLARCTPLAPAAGVILKEYLESRTTIMAGRPIYSFRDVSESWITKVELTDRNAFVFGVGTKAMARFAPYSGEVFEGELTKQAGIADEDDSLYTV